MLEEATATIELISNEQVLASTSLDVASTVGPPEVAVVHGEEAQRSSGVESRPEEVERSHGGMRTELIRWRNCGWRDEQALETAVVAGAAIPEPQQDFQPAPVPAQGNRSSGRKRNAPHQFDFMQDGLADSNRCTH